MNSFAWPIEGPQLTWVSMKYWLDTEFIAHPFTIDLISIGLVAENGREFHAESSEVSCQDGDFKWVEPRGARPALARR